MNQQKKEASEERADRVRVNDLPQQPEELKDSEARDINGGGGLPGGVTMGRKGEETPNPLN